MSRAYPYRHGVVRLALFSLAFLALLFLTWSTYVRVTTPVLGITFQHTTGIVSFVDPFASPSETIMKGDQIKRVQGQLLTEFPRADDFIRKLIAELIEQEGVGESDCRAWANRI